MTRSLTRAAPLAALLTFLFALPVLAHAELVSASPGPDDVVQGSPPELVAEFNQDLNPSRTSISVRNAAGDVLAEGGEPGGNPREWRLTLPPLEPGTYRVRYTSFSAEDGEIHRAQYTFTVEAAASPTPPQSLSPTASASATPSTLPTPTPATSTLPTSSASASSSPAPSIPPSPGSGPGFDLSMALPIIFVLAVVAVLGLWLLRRRTG